MGQMYKHSKYQFLTSSLKAPGSSSSESQTFSANKLTTTSAPSATDKHGKNLNKDILSLWLMPIMIIFWTKLSMVKNEF